MGLIISTILVDPSNITHWRDLIWFVPIILQQFPRSRGRKHNAVIRLSLKVRSNFPPKNSATAFILS